MKNVLGDSSRRRLLAGLFLGLLVSSIALLGLTPRSLTAVTSILDRADVIFESAGGDMSIVPPRDIATKISSGSSTLVALGRPLVTIPEGLSVSVYNDAPSTGPIPTGAVGYWSFDNNAEDASGKGNDATLDNAVISSGRIGGALSLEGDGSAKVSHSASLQLKASYAISAWIKMDTLNPPNDIAQIIQKVDSSYNRYYMYFDKLTKTISFGFKYDSNFQTVSTLKTDWTTGKWYHITGTYNPNGGSNNMKIYVNGKLDNAETEAGNPVSNGGDLVIGGTADVTRSNWYGLIDEVRIYDRELSLSEVSDLYNSPFLSFPAGTNIITWTVKDIFGRVARAIQVISIDNSDPNFPKSSLSFSSPNYLDSIGTYVTSQNDIRISSSSSTGISSTYYRYYWNNANSKPDFTQGTTFKMTGSDGKYIVQFYSISKNGLREPLKTQTVILDNSKSESSKIAPGFVAGTSGFTLSATDNSGGAGIGDSAFSGIYYKFDSDSSWSFVKTKSTSFFITGPNESSRTVSYYSIDNVGNKEPMNQVTFSFYNRCQEIPLDRLNGVNFIDPILIAQHSGPLFDTPQDYVKDSLLKLREYGFNVIRVPYAWEAYEYDPEEFLAEAKGIAYIAERTGICVIFDFHHSFWSSYFKDGAYGFPYFLLNKYEQGGGEEEAKVFFSDFLNNTISYNGVSAWDLQAQFMYKIIGTVDKYTSVLGHEIINEPTLYDHSQYKKIGQYHTYIAKKLRLETEKYIFFTAERTVGVKRDHVLDDLIVPTGVTKIVFAPHVYSTVNTDSGAEWQMKKWQENTKLWGGVPIFIAEWAVDNKSSMNTNIDYFKSSKEGWAYWAYTPYTLNLPYQQLIDENYEPTQYLKDLLEARNS